MHCRFATVACVVLSLGSIARCQDLLPDTDLLEGLEWREVGPYRGGRSCAVAGIPQERETFYFGSCGGGVWKTRDGGTSWKNVSDEFFGGSIGSVAVSEWDPNVVWVGTGEKTVRGNVSHGDGVWRSTDAGRTWSHVGLPDSRHVCRIRVHPRDPDHAYAAALGHLFGPNEERGVFETRDGGKTWKRILHVNPHAGCVDLAMDPTNPRILYACFWRILRTPWSLESGGEGSGIWKSTDGGATWKDISKNAGLPRGTWGISGISVSNSDPDNLYAIIEAKEGGVFRSTDAGKTWKRTNQERKLRQRAWYYSRIVADPADADAVYVLNVRFHRSKDGGKTFKSISVPHGDNHDLWIDPGDARRMIQSNDGGANVSFDGGRTWSRQDNQPTAQMYRVSTDSAFPYRLLGGQQDNSALRIRSRSATAGSIGTRDWDPTAGGESGHIVAKPDDPDIVFGGSYGGSLGMVNHRTGERRSVNVWPDNPMGWGAAELKYRFQWNYPLFFSPHDPDLLYAAGNVLFRSRDLGASWEAVSGDLTRNDKSKQGPSGGPITKDNTSVEYYCTIFAALESPHEKGVLWCGSDDGLIHVSRDDGGTWKNVTPKDLPEWTQINSIEAHPFEKGGLYVAGTRYKLDDFHPYLWRTTDYGASWTRIDGGLPENSFTRVIRADPSRKGLLYAGTETGVWMSLDDGASWKILQLKLPRVPITDLAVKDKDLVAATQGRGFWILDDLTPLHELKPAVHRSPAYLFVPRPALRLSSRRSRNPRGAGTNPPSGAVIHYWLAKDVGPGEAFSLEILDGEGRLLRTYTRKPRPEDPPAKKKAKRAPGAEDLRQLPAKKGLNRFVWNLSHPPAKGFPDMILWSGRLAGPRAIPGTYSCRLKAGTWTEQVLFSVVPDPRSSATPADYAAQLAFMLSVRDELTRTHEAIRDIRSLDGQLKSLRKRLEGREDAQTVREAAKQLADHLGDVQKALYQTRNKSRQDPLNFPIRLNDKLAGVLSLAGRGDFAPTKQLRAVRRQLGSAIQKQLTTFGQLLEKDLPELNRLAREAGLPAISLKQENEGDQ